MITVCGARNLLLKEDPALPKLLLQLVLVQIYNLVTSYHTIKPMIKYGIIWGNKVDYFSVNFDFRNLGSSHSITTRTKSVIKTGTGNRQAKNHYRELIASSQLLQGRVWRSTEVILLRGAHSTVQVCQWTLICVLADIDTGNRTWYAKWNWQSPEAEYH